jgi:hypothetical protein
LFGPVEFQLLPSPEDGPFGVRIKSFRIKNRGLVVVTQHAGVECHRNVDASKRIWTISDDVTQTIDLINTKTSDVGKHGLNGL